MPSDSKRVVKNTFFLYIRMLLVMLINIFSVRFILKGLGSVDYGLFNVIAGLVTMLAGVSSTIASAIQRFYSYALGEQKESYVSTIFSASINIYAIFALFVLIFGEFLGVWFIEYQMIIPEERIVAAHWLYQMTMLSFILSFMAAPFSALIFAYEKMHVFSIISVADCVLKFFLALSLKYILYDKLVYYGLGLLLISLAAFLAYLIVVLSERKVHYVKVKDRKLYRRMLSFSGWSLLSSSAGIGISQLLTMITNVFFGPLVNAARAIAFQVSSALSSFTSNIIMAISPPMVKLYAEGNYSSVNNYFRFSNKIVYYSLLLLLLPVFFEIKFILELWLDVNDAQTILFCRLILIYALILSLNNPISIIIKATGNIRAYSTYVEIPTLLCVPITYFLFVSGYPAESAFYVMIIAIIFSHVIRLVCLKKLFAVFSYQDYLFSFVIPALVITFVVSFVVFYIRNYFIDGFDRLIVVVILNSILLAILSLYFGFQKAERNRLYALFNMHRILQRIGIN